MNGLLIGVEPVILRLGPLTLRWSGLILATALLAGLWVTVRRAESAGTSARFVVELASWALPIGFVGARLFNIAENWEYYLTRPAEILDLSSRGLNAWGALVSGGLAAWVFCGRKGGSWGGLADAAAPGQTLAEAIGRLGNFIDGDGQGRPASFFWATRYSSSDALTPDFGVARHPAQLYQGLADLAILGAFWLVRNADLPCGARFWLWLGFYGLSRVVVGLVRLDPVFLFGLQQAQLIGLAAVGLSAFGIIRVGLRPRSPASSAAR